MGVLHDGETARAVEMEREVVRLLKGDCHSPIGALAVREGEGMTVAGGGGGAGGAAAGGAGGGGW